MANKNQPKGVYYVNISNKKGVYYMLPPLEKSDPKVDRTW